MTVFTDFEIIKIMNFKSILPSFILLLCFQIAGSQNIKTFISNVNQDSVLKTVRELSGEDSVIINGTKTIIKYRAAYLGFNLTENYLIERLTKYNLKVETTKYSINGLNIFGIQKGTKYPDEFFIVGAHHDAVTTFCADDDASGCAAVLEAARIFSSVGLEYSVIYAFWDEEEAGLWGSTNYAKQARANGQTFKGIINLDMIGYDSNNDQKFEIQAHPDPTSVSLADSVLSVINQYNLNLVPIIINPGSDRGDHYSFWKQGFFNAINIGEQIFTDDPNPAYHTENDRIGIFNIPYFIEISKLTIGLMATLAQPVASAISGENQMKATIYPNPTTGILHVTLGNQAETKICMYDISGRVVLEKIFYDPIFSFDMHHLNEGVYLLLLKNENGIMFQRISKIH